jgi:hypothetical protein
VGKAVPPDTRNDGKDQLPLGLTKINAFACPARFGAHSSESVLALTIVWQRVTAILEDSAENLAKTTPLVLNPNLIGWCQHKRWTVFGVRQQRRACTTAENNGC